MSAVSATSDFDAARYVAKYGAAGADADVGDFEDVISGVASSNSSPGQQAVIDGGPSSATVIFQGKLVTVHRLLVDLKPIDISTLPQEKYDAYIEGEQLRLEANKQYLQNQYTQISEPDYSHDARLASYATITVGGKVVATIDNQGVVGTANDGLGARLMKILLGDVNGTNCPNLAKARAEQIAKLLGGKIVPSSTAITQQRFEAMPAFEAPTATVDEVAMKKDPLYQQLQDSYAHFERLKQDRKNYLASQASGAA